jgi:tRNA A-37 threonylcarbamoyl transferase component Bud32
MTETPPSFPKNISRYEIRREIGRGGMATVYLAYDPNFGREVAIKILPQELLHDPAFRTRFHREARTIAALEHPAIVPVYDFGEEDGQPFLVMRYLSDGSLVARIRAGPIPAEAAARILSRIGSALDAAHAQGVVHRDLKPANILFDQYGEAYLGDFGIAQLSGGGSTLTGSMILGTPAYMSPEQISGEKKVDGRSDIYALGIVVFEMLTGQTPFQADSPVKLMMMHVSTPPPLIPETEAKLPPGSAKVLERALAKEPDARFQKAADFSRAFQDVTAERKPLPDAAPIESAGPLAETKDFARADVRVEGPAIPPSAVRGKPTRWILWAGVAAAIAVCLCLGGGGGAVFLNSDFGKWLLAAPVESTPTIAPTAAVTQTGILADTPIPSVEAHTPTLTLEPYIPGQTFRLTDGNNASSQPRIAVDSEGVAHAFWMDKSDALNGKVFHRALDKEGTWTDPGCISCLVGNPEYMYEYKFAAREKERACIAFQWTPEYRYVVSTACFHGTGVADIEEAEMPTGEIDFLMAMDPSGDLVTFFLSTKTIHAGDQILSDSSLYMYSPAFGIDTEGGYHLAWIRDSEPPVLVYSYSRGGDAAWSAPKALVSQDVSISSELQLFAGPEGEMFLLIGDSPGRILRWKGSWSPVRSLAEDYLPYDFSFVITKNGKLILLSTGYYSGNRGIWAFKFNEETGDWKTPILLRKLDSLMMNGFSAAVTPGGKLLLAYGQNDEDVLKGEIFLLEVASP